MYITKGEFREYFLKKYEKLLIPHGFQLKKVNFKRTTQASFFYEKGPNQYIYEIYFLSNSYVIETYISLTDTEVYGFIKKIYPKHKEFDPITICRLDYYVMPENSSGYFQSNKSNSLGYSYDTWEEIDKLVVDAYEQFKLGVPRFIENTDTLQKLDKLTNDNPRFEREKRGAIGNNLHFNGTSIEIIVGVISGYLTENPKLIELIPKYKAYWEKNINPEIQDNEFWGILLAYLDENSY